MPENPEQYSENSNHPRLEIPFSKAGTIALILYNLVVVGLGVALWFMAGRFNLLVEAFFKLTAVGGIMFFGSSIMLFTAKLFQQKPGFVIDQAGIIDNADALSAGRIYWEEIREIAQWEFMGQVMILLKVQDPKRVLKEQNLFKRTLMRLNQKRFETPVSITCGALQIDHEKLYELIRQNLEQKRE